MSQRILMAPMEGVVDHHLRAIYAAIGGIDQCVTEFVRITHTQLPEKVFRRYCPELDHPIRVPVHVQLLGSDPEYLALNARKAARMGARAIDLNFGCPAKSVNQHRGGACLLQEPDLLHRIVKAVREAVPAETPVTAKIRLGYETRTGFLETAKAIEAGGASELVVHARSKTDGYKPPAYWHLIADIRQAVTLNVVANGEIWTPADYHHCRATSGCQDVMLGRGLLAQPDLACEIKAELKGQPYQPLTWASLLPVLEQFHLNTLSAYPLKFCGNRLKQWLMYLKTHYPEAETFFETIKKTRNPEDIQKAFARAL